MEAGSTTSFLHGDLHDMNIMGSPACSLTAIIDWGDAGWGDPILDFAEIPLRAIPDVLEAYESERESELRIDSPARARLVWDILLRRMDELYENPGHRLRLDELRRFLG